MKRPPGLWFLLSAGVLWLSLQDVYGIRATALIFGKSTTSTTESAEGLDEETATTDPSTENSNTTKPSNLTGIPQIDYVWDPNLPQELNGYNLSLYPFYERVPEEIDFKCDGLHDGFYASVPHKCQVYHHCLFGTRYDFLCANYTAFDQKTFICQFVSVVDCVNSKKFWHRNDALYQAATTTTYRPIVIHTTAPPSAEQPLEPRRPGSPGRRRPYRRRRPQYDYYDDEYYDDYYEERPRPQARRKRPRPRPVFDEDYEEEYEEDYHKRRMSGRRDEDRRRPYRRRNKDRRTKPEYDDEVEERFEDEDFKERKTSRTKNEEEVKDRKPSRTKHDEEEVNERKPTRNKYEEEAAEPEWKSYGNRKNSNRRPVEDDYEEAPVPKRKKDSKPELSETLPIIKPVSGTIYDRPRVAPRIRLPVPKSEADKYAYKPIGTTAAPIEEEEYYDDYEEVATKRTKSRKQAENTRNRKKPETTTRASHKTTSRSRKRPTEEYDYSYEEVKPTRKSTTTIKPEETRNKSDYRRPPSKTSTSTTTSEPPPVYKPDPIVRVVKRPFLPSRGGNPYASRNLQPVGNKAPTSEPPLDPEPTPKTTPEPIGPPSIPEPEEPPFKPSPALLKIPLSHKKEYQHGPRTTQKPKLPDPIDLNEYDVTINDALNPTLPNLPVRGFPTGFSPSSDYTFSAFQRQRYVVDPVISPSNSDYVLHATAPKRQRFEAVPLSTRTRTAQSQAYYTTF